MDLDGSAFDGADGLFELGAGSVVGYGLAVAVELAGGYAVHPAGGG